jgi:MerR family transcriptional regulator/heat shock protein HspR
MKNDKRQERDRALYIISVAAEIVGMHPQTLRLYEREGLLTPGRTAKHSRRYSEDDIERLRLIQRLTRQYGVNLAGVRMIMELQERVDHLEAVVDEVEKRARQIEREMDEEIERVRRSYSREITLFRPGTLMK